MWYSYLAYFLGGVFLANGVPHFVHGISGKKFQTPFASPAGIGESSPPVNVIWGIVNFYIGYALIFGVSDFAFGMTVDALVAGFGFLLASVALALYFGRVRGR